MRFDAPLALLILLAIPLVIAWRRRRRRAASLRFPSATQAARSGRSWRQRLSGVPTFLRVAALALLAVALARPQKGTERVRETSKGVAIMMVLDRSSSMKSAFDFRGQRSTRLDTCKAVFQDFVLGNRRDLPGRPNDLIGMVTFARYADMACPLTLGHGALARFLEPIHIVQPGGPQDATAIGDALALAAAWLKNAENDLARETDGEKANYEIKSKVIILLTDGENNYGKRTPDQAAQLAKKWGIKVYAIGVGGETVQTVQTIFGPQLMRTGEAVDIAPLKAIAEATGGIARVADDADSLHAVYKEIDRLEKSEVESVRFLDYRELFTPFALLALALLFVETGLSATVFRRIP